MKPFVIYHDRCNDGFGAAWAARKRFGEGNVEFYPASHGQTPPDVGARDVYLLDFSYKQDAMRRLVSLNRRVVVIDHHKTAEAELVGIAEKMGIPKGDDQFTLVYDVNKSGARLAYEYFFPGRSVPRIIDYVEDRDLWRWALPVSREINACIASHPHDFALWDHWATLPPAHEEFERMADEGAAILRYQRQCVDSQVKNAAEVELAGHKILAVNATHLISEIAGKLAEGRPFGACWFVRGDGKNVWSLRSTKDGIDVSEVAKEFGGGGHKNAAGFEVQYEV